MALGQYSGDADRNGSGSVNPYLGHEIPMESAEDQNRAVKSKGLSRHELPQSKSVSDVAQELGFSSIYVFSRAYKNYFGYAPTAQIVDKIFL